MHPDLANPAGRIGPYRILERLGSGGMGEVFLAYDERLDRRVAIKRIRLEAGGSSQRRERFRREARMAARLSHPAIVQVHDILEENGADYIVMEYVEGTSLREIVDRGPLPARRVVELACELADGLDAAHRAGIVHRDLKTENVLITPSGRPKIADFGIAKRLLAEEEEEESLTADHTVLGTCRVMSPEQARGEPVDHRTDLFALGVLLYEALTAESPFQAENSLATLNRVIHHRQTPVRDLAPATPQDLSDLVDRLLEKEPLLRPGSAGQVRRELDRLALTTPEPTGTETILEIPVPSTSASPAATPEVSPVQRIGGTKWLPDSALTGVDRRRRLAWGLLALVLLAAGLGIWGYLASRPPPPPLYVAVLKPEIGEGAANGEVKLVASGVRVALLQGLVSLEGVSPQTFEEVDAASGPPRQVARAVAADELIGTHLDCRTEVCRVSLSRGRGADGRALWADSFDVPTDDPTVAAGVVRSHLQQAYSDHAIRKGMPALRMTRGGYEEFLRLRARFESREASLEEILKGLEDLRKASPGFLEAELLEAEVLRYHFWTSRDPADLRRGLELIQEVRKAAPGDPRPLLIQIDLALFGNDLKLATKALGELEPLIPGDARLLERQARILSAQGKTPEALETLRAAVRLQPSSKRLHNLALMEFQKGQVAAARKTLDLLLARSPDHYDGLSLLATLEMLNGDLNRAISLYRDLVRRTPRLTELTNLGLSYFFAGRYAEAAEIYRHALAQAPRQPGYTLTLADAELMLGHKEEAAALYRQAVKLVDEDPGGGEPTLLTNKAQALAHLGQGRQAAAAAQEAVRLAPDDGPVRFEAALVYALLGENSSALANAERAVQLGMGERWFSLPWFAPLKSDAEFQALLARVKAPAAPGSSGGSARGIK